ncbi:hypothetical protein K456DRAFT_1515741 [Colletotrichum gloeosporioides 23]|nr:hypothetical protein K456DRAFT_1515741 [Colletotrichum gloeosporioides 23]
MYMLNSASLHCSSRRANRTAFDRREHLRRHRRPNGCERSRRGTCAFAYLHPPRCPLSPRLTPCRDSPCRCDADVAVLHGTTSAWGRTGRRSRMRRSA